MVNHVVELFNHVVYVAVVCVHVLVVFHGSGVVEVCGEVNAIVVNERNVYNVVGVGVDDTHFSCPFWVVKFTLVVPSF